MTDQFLVFLMLVFAAAAGFVGPIAYAVWWITRRRYDR